MKQSREKNRLQQNELSVHVNVESLVRLLVS